MEPHDENTLGHLKQSIQDSALDGMVRATHVPVPGSSLNNLPGFDLTNLLEMLGDEKLIIRLMEIFYQDSVNILSDLERGIAEGDLDVVKTMLHTIKGSAGAIGATDLLRASIILEQNIMQGHAQSSANERFAITLRQAREAIQSILPGC